MNAVIIGGGPAGVSAALYLVRAGIDTTIFTMGPGALAKAHKIENYYGFPEGISGIGLYEAGIAQAKNLGVQIIEEEILGMAFEEKLTAITKTGRYPADAFIFATGASRLAPPIEGLKEFEGKGVSYCATCDGYFYRGRKIAVIGYTEYAMSELEELMHLAGESVLLTNGQEPEAEVPAGARVITAKIARISGEGRNIDTVTFEDGTEEKLDGIFVAWGSAGSAALAKKIGALTEGNNIVVNAEMATNAPGVFAAGDCDGGLLQVAKAVCDGAIAGTSAVKYLRSLQG